MTAELLALLDQLDEARAKATPGEWVHNPINGVHTPVGSCVATTHRHDDAERRADAALIAAAVNSLPQLTAALRGVLAECESAERDVSELLGLRMGLRIASNVGSDTIREAITGALTPEPVQP